MDCYYIQNPIHLNSKNRLVSLVLVGQPIKKENTEFKPASLSFKKIDFVPHAARGGRVR